ncbi:hypothetical protein [Deinococcus ficus]|uniref:Phosphohydrolase n=1 Tax=Deinococcus ficus TaxID=317577 RepID=A0A221T2M5_9DEIO|nr:hypothetical protein [Deinococcus ficus]ASN83152.1 hypothetical protein DFI_18295 [Deinococcus ficus]
MKSRPPPGTLTLLFGAHQFLLHPLWVAAAWTRLYGFPLDPRLWVAFTVHDWGYWGKPNLDGPEGETHVELGARIMARLFGRDWGEFTLYHSRYYAARNGRAISRLCVADKYAAVITPSWLYLPCVRFTGEVNEYLHEARSGKYAALSLLDGAHHGDELRVWHRSMVRVLRRWVAAHRHTAERYGS